MNDNTFMSPEYYAAMQIGKPLKVYKKVILAKVFVQILNPYSGLPEGTILQGIPSRNDEGCFVPIWSAKEDVFFVSMNKIHILDGAISEVPVEVYMSAMSLESDDKKINYGSFTEQQVEDIVNSKFMSLRATLNKADSESFIYRLLDKAKELEKSDAITKAITARLSEIQSLEVSKE